MIAGPTLKEATKVLKPLDHFSPNNQNSKNIKFKGKQSILGTPINLTSS